MEKKYTFEVVDLNTIDTKVFNDFPHKSVNTTKEWIEFIAEDSSAIPYTVRITHGETLEGFFSSLIVKKFGLKIVGSPFPGWSTVYMGLDVYDHEQKAEILKELIPFVMKNTKCVYLQICDRDFKAEELEPIRKEYGGTIEFGDTLELGIEGDDALQYKKMKSDCRNFIKQFERRGAVIEEAEPTEAFAEEYYEQLKDVFAKQDLVPTYTVDKVKCLLKHLSKTGNIYCLRVKDPEGTPIATSIFPGFNHKMFFWGGASLRPFQQYRPNEYMIYKAMHYWRERGCVEFDMVGNRAYKKKFGAWEVSYPSIIIPKYRILVPLKNMAASLYYFSGKLFWKLHIRRF